MNEGNSNASAAIKLEAAIADDKRSAVLRFKSGDKTEWLLAADTAAVEALIAHLGNTRSQMLDPVSMDMPVGTFPFSAFDPRWQITPDNSNRFACFWIRHPGFGWSIYAFPRYEAGNIAKWLRKITAITSTRDTQSPAATSLGGDTFLFTTEGLGFYYYGKGEKRIGPNPFEQIEFDSDRAAGIVSGSIAERRLEDAMRSRLRADKPEIAQGLFRPSGPLGSFSVKIDHAYLSGILSDEAYKDLINLKNIRNDFAHDLEMDLFDRQSIKARCENFILVDRHVGPVPPTPSIDSIPTPPAANPYMGLPDYKVKLSDPRFRYVMTAQIISSQLGEGSERADALLPLV